MKSISRSDKRRKISVKGMESRTQNFEEIIEKQLKDDFKVHEYLNENPPDGKNTEQYIDLYNKLLVRKKEKTKKKELLESSKAKFTSKDGKGDLEGGNNVADLYYSEEEFLAIKAESDLQQEAIEAKTQQEIEMKEILWKQIGDKKKSLNLLKGDIGYLITRNESISILQNKVNTVSLVSKNQLKRVSMALSKDWQEVQERQGMQRRFHRKLRSVESFEKKNLKKIKNSYIEGMKRKKQIHDKLMQIEKQCASIDEYSDKEKQLREKNIISKQAYQLLQNLCELIGQSKSLENQFSEQKISIQEYSLKLKEEFEQLFIKERDKMTNRSRLRSTTPLSFRMVKKSEGQSKTYPYNDEVDTFNIEIINQHVLKKFVAKILEEYDRVMNQTLEKNKIHCSLMEKIEGQWAQIMILERKSLEIILEFNKDQESFLSNPNTEISQYLQTFKKLEQNVKALCFLMYFLSNKLGAYLQYDGFGNQGLSYVSKLYSNCLFHCKMSENSSFACEESAQVCEGIFDNISEKLPLWFQILKQKRYNSSEDTRAVLRNPKKNQTIFIENSEKQRFMSVQSENQIKKIEDDEENEDQQQLVQSDFINKFGFLLQQGGKEKLENCVDEFIQHLIGIDASNSDEVCAKRVLLLEKIDQKYYKMIKQTLQMEKENTKKNYQFQKNFKRAKYSTQDELLEEKRFQSTFSGLFKHEKDSPINTAESKVFKQNSSVYNSQSRFKRGKNCSYSTHNEIKSLNLKSQTAGTTSSIHANRRKPIQERLIFNGEKVKKIRNNIQKKNLSSDQAPQNLRKSQTGSNKALNLNTQKSKRPQTSGLVGKRDQKRLSKKLKTFLQEI